MAFPASENQAVDDFHRTALEAGYRDNGRPGERPEYHAGYYAAFVLDPGRQQHRAGEPQPLRMIALVSSDPWLTVGIALIAAVAALSGALIAAVTAGRRQRAQLQATRNASGPNCGTSACLRSSQSCGACSTMPLATSRTRSARCSTRPPRGSLMAP